MLLLVVTKEAGGPGPGSGRDFFQDKVHIDGKEREVFQLSVEGLTLLSACYFNVSNHSMIVSISFVDFLSTDFTYRSVSLPGPGPKAEALGERPWCPGASASDLWRSGPALLLPAGGLPSFPVGRSRLAQLGTGQMCPDELPGS